MLSKLDEVDKLDTAKVRPQDFDNGEGSCLVYNMVLLLLVTKKR